MFLLTIETSNSLLHGNPFIVCQYVSSCNISCSATWVSSNDKKYMSDGMRKCKSTKLNLTIFAYQFGNKWCHIQHNIGKTVLNKVCNTKRSEEYI